MRAAVYFQVSYARSLLYGMYFSQRRLLTFNCEFIIGEAGPSLFDFRL